MIHCQDKMFTFLIIYLRRNININVNIEKQYLVEVTIIHNIFQHSG